MTKKQHDRRAVAERAAARFLRFRNMPGIFLTASLISSALTASLSPGNPDDSPSYMEWEDLIYLADLFMAGGVRELSILGSGSQAHPHFLDMLAYLLERGFFLNVMTTGMFPDAVLSDVESVNQFLHQQRISFLCDMTELAHGRECFDNDGPVAAFLRTLNDRVTPCITIEEPEFSLYEIVNLINSYYLKRKIHVSLGQPDPFTDRLYLEPEQIGDAVEHLMSQRNNLDPFRVKLDLDCGFILCQFTDDQLSYLVKNVPGFSTGPCVPGITIGHDMTAWSCRQLPGFSRLSVFDFNSYEEMIQYYNNQHFNARFESSGCFLACDTCMIREDIICSGGCLAHILPRYKGEHPYNIGSNPLRRKEVFD